MAYRLRRRGRIYYVECYDADGRRRRISTKQRDHKAAQRVAPHIERRVAAEDRASAPISLRQGAQALARQDARAGRSEATIEVHETKAGHLGRILGWDFNLRQLGPGVLRRYADQRLSEVAWPNRGEDEPRHASRHTVHKELGVLRQCCRLTGAEWRAEWMPDLGTYYEPGERWLTRAEYDRLLLALSADRADYVTAWCHTGIDEGPLYALRAEHVDLARRTVWVPDHKTPKRARTVPLSGEAFEVLRRRVNRAGGEPLFPVWTNSHRDLARACTRAGIATVSAKDLRRTFCSWMANAGVSPLVCARLMGHGSTRMVEHVYARLGYDVQRDAIDRLAGVTVSVPARAASDADSAQDARTEGE